MRKLFLSLAIFFLSITAASAARIVVNQSQHTLTLYENDGNVVQYPVGTGRPGFTWHGRHPIVRKAEWPAWRPPAAMLKRRPDLPRWMAGGEENPLGARAMYLGGTMYRIHGSNEPNTIGHSVSSGCIRMRNEDVVDLYNRVPIGTMVTVK